MEEPVLRLRLQPIERLIIPAVPEQCQVRLARITTLLLQHQERRLEYRQEVLPQLPTLQEEAALRHTLICDQSAL